MDKKVDIVYVVASQLGSIGMGSAAYNAVKGIENSKKFSYRIFCRGHKKNLDINKKNIFSYGYLEYFSYPFRFLEKKLKIRINSFKIVNYLFGKKVYKNLPKCKIYHTWMDISPESIKKAKEEGAILVLEAANSHPLNRFKLLEEEHKDFFREEFTPDFKKFKSSLEYLKKFDYVLCPSDFVYNSFLEQGFSKEKLIRMPYGVNLEKFSPRRRKKSRGKFRVIFVGSIQLRKGIQYLLKAWEELNFENAELIVIGTVWPDATKIIEKYRKNKTIKFDGFNPNLREVYEKGDVFVFPSIEEGSALVNYEAMASGLPVITTFNSGSVVRDKKDGFIIPIRNVEVIKEKIKFMYQNPKKCVQMGKSARKYIENFTWDKYGKRLVGAYKKILEKGKES
jgi:glycosyltransferase involved in cell wall biosynthesis